MDRKWDLPDGFSVPLGLSSHLNGSCLASLFFGLAPPVSRL